MMLATMRPGPKRMSHLRYSRIALLLVLGFALARTASSLAADKKSAGKGQCPDEWHLKDEEKPYKGGKVFMCIPDKPPTKVTCHPDTEYFEEDGAFGCEIPPEIEDDVEEEEEQ